jgi:hypothetical protein
MNKTADLIREYPWQSQTREAANLLAKAHELLEAVESGNDPRLAEAAALIEQARAKLTQKVN